MPHPGTIIGQITEELGELGKKAVTETAKVPQDIAGKALESLGGSSGKKQSAAASCSDTKKPAESVWGQIASAKDKKTKQVIARAALEQLAGVKKQKEPSVWERIQMEVEQKKQLAAQQRQQAAKQQLPKMWQKPKRGQLWLSTKQKAGSETSRNVRQD